MATFVKGVTTDFEPQQLYKPDYEFLTKVYGTKQAEYDRGYNHVKSLYNSMMNNPLTSSDNEAHRKEVFKKIQGTLKDATTLDLSNAANIGYAQEAIDPIAKDKQFIYDMAVTSRHANELQKLERVRTSMDPKISSQYNEYSRRAIQLATDDLKNAKRNDGSIFKVQPQEFIPYQDVVADLNKAAKEQNLNIEITQATGSGYFIKQSNGKLAYEPYTKWAMQAIGNKYDRQFQQQGYVEGESLIRGIMSSQNISRQEAINTIAPKITKQLLNESMVNAGYSDEKVKEYDMQIEKFRDKYGEKGIPTSGPVYEAFLKVKTERNAYVNALAESKNEQMNLQEKGDQYVTSNLYNIFTNEAKKKTALGWAMTHADATAKVDMTSDSTWVAKYHEANTNMRHNQDMAYKYKALELNTQLGAQRNAISAQSNQIALLKAKYPDGIPTEQLAGVYTSEAEVPAVKTLQNDLVAVDNDMFNKAFSSSNGLINILYNNSSKDKFTMYPILAKIKNIADGQTAKLTPQELKSLTDFGNRTGIEIANPNNRQNAQFMLRKLAFDVYDKSGKMIDVYKKSKQTNALEGKLQNFEALRVNFKSFADRTTQIDKSYNSIAKEMLDSNGRLKSMYIGAKVIGYTKNNVPIFDVSKLSEPVKARLNSIVGTNYSSKSRPVGSTIIADNVQQSEYYQFVNYNTSKDDASAIKSLVNDKAAFQSVFGKQAVYSYDPGKEVVIMKLNTNAKAAKALGLSGLKSTYQLELPYDHVRNNANILSRPYKYLDDNTVTASRSSILKDLAVNKYAKISAPKESKALGLDWTVYGSTDSNGNYGVQIVGTMENPANGKKVNFEEFVPGTPGDDTLLYNTEHFINTVSQKYLSNLHAHDKNYGNDINLGNFDAILNE